MLSKNKIKFITSLALKKNRDEQNLFVAEGEKCTTDLLNTFHCQNLIATTEWLQTHRDVHADEIIEATTDELKKISYFKTPSSVVAIFEKPSTSLNVAEIKNELTLFLDTIQDPGNLGTIIRIADWFGIHNVLCTKDTADICNPKSIQATMGAYARVRVHYAEANTFFTACIQQHIPIYGTFLDGTDICQTTLTPNGIIVMGNEGNGISKNIEQYVSHHLLIPNYPIGAPTSESLNVAIATGITCYEFRRRFTK